MINWLHLSVFCPYQLYTVVTTVVAPSFREHWSRTRKDPGKQHWHDVRKSAVLPTSVMSFLMGIKHSHFLHHITSHLGSMTSESQLYYLHLWCHFYGNKTLTFPSSHHFHPIWCMSVLQYVLMCIFSFAPSLDFKGQRVHFCMFLMYSEKLESVFSADH